MDFAQLESLTNALEDRYKADYRKLLMLAGLGNNVWPQFAEHLAAAETLRDFYEAVYNDEELKFEKLWGEYAKLRHKPWHTRFQHEASVRDIVNRGHGLIMESPDTQILLNTSGRGAALDILIYPEAGFNEDAAEYYMSFTGKFTLMGLELDGTYDIFFGMKTIMFMRWELDNMGNRVNPRYQQGACCA